MSKGQRIDDHSFWAGGKSKGSPFPDGGHKLKDEMSANGAGELDQYQDTTETIKAMQMQAKGKVKSYPLKPNTRN